MKINFLKFWLTQKLPLAHSKPNLNDLGRLKKLRAYVVHYLSHPIKRRIARLYVFVLQKFFNLMVIGITGSVGKTTVKEMIASILRLKGNTVSSIANIDPVYNIPTTILKCTPLTRYLVLEMGVEYPEEMDFYLWLVKPKLGLITHIYPTHTQFLKDVKGVFNEKVKLVREINEKGCVVLNGEDRYLNSLKGKLKARTIYYSGKNTIKAENISVNNDLSTNFTLGIGEDKKVIHLASTGYSYVENAVAASAVCYSIGIDIDLIKKGLENFKPLEHRIRPIRIGKALIIDDSYNNNPEAAKATIEIFKGISKNKKMIVVFGDMLELGAISQKAHQEIGRILGNLPLTLLVCVGEYSKITLDQASKVLGREKCIWVRNEKEVDKFIKPYLNENSVILIKGSRSIRLDNLVKRLS